MTNSADPDQLASGDANWSGSTLFAKTRHDVFSKSKVKAYQSPLKNWAGHSIFPTRLHVRPADSDQPALKRSLNGIFTGHFVGSQGTNASSCVCADLSES